ncbi:MAG: PqqD family protein [Spirosomataceae bacterium]
MDNYSFNSLAIERKTDNVYSTLLDDELVIMDAMSGDYVTLNPIARVIWDKLEHSIHLDDLISHLLSAYDITEEICREETIRFLTKLHQLGLLK